MRMCKQYEEIERKLQQFRGLRTPGMDQLSLSMIAVAIESLEADRAILKHADEVPSLPARTQVL